MDVKEEVEKVAKVASVNMKTVAEAVEIADLKILLDLQKDLEQLRELAKTKIELFEHKVVIVQLQLKTKYQMGDLDTIDSQTGKINRK